MKINKFFLVVERLCLKYYIVRFLRHFHQCVIFPSFIKTLE